MQTALDSTALMLSKTVATQSSSEFQASASNYFDALLTNKSLIQPTVSTSYTTVGGSRDALNASANVKTDIIRIFGFD